MFRLDVDLLPGTLIADRYRLVREAGRGGMAVVWVARDVKLDRDVAIKAIDASLTGAVGTQRFLREITVVSRLSHPNILPVDDCGELNGRPFYVMPYIAGETLEALIRREGQLQVSDALRITRDVAAALGHAHRNGIVHRDIKPANILLHDGEPLVADFGIAHSVAGINAEKLTATGVAVGTPVYMSPEQATAEPRLDGRSDIYSLGCVLYEMLTGHPPFFGSSSRELIARHQLDSVPSIRSARPDISEDLEGLVMRCLAKAPADRFPTADDLASAVRTMIGAPAARPAPASRGSSPRRRRMILAGSAIAVAALSWWATAGKHQGRTLDPNRIAVLYFDDRSDGGKLRFFADGLTEALIGQLSSVKQLKVISANGVAPFRGAAPSPDSIGRLLNVGTLVTGNLQQSGGRMRVNVALVDAATGEQLAQRTVERASSDYLSLQDALAEEVALALRQSLGKELERRVVRGTKRLDAWMSFQQNKRTLVAADDLLAAGDVDAAMRKIAEAESDLVKAGEIDKRWPAPVSARSQLFIRRTLTVGFGRPEKIPEWLAKASVLADSAMSIDSMDADALEARGTSRYFKYMYQVAPDSMTRRALRDTAERDFKAAVRLNPVQTSAWNALAHLYTSRDQYADAKVAALNAYNSDPYASNFSRTLWTLFTASRLLGDRGEAGKWCDLGRQRDSGNFRFAECRLQYLGMEGGQPSADSIWAAFRQFVRLSPAGRRDLDSLKAGQYAALALFRSGLKDSARRVAARSRASANIDPAGDVIHLERDVYHAMGDSVAEAAMTRQYRALIARRAQETRR